MEGLETERLIFRQWKSTDFEDFARYFANEASAKYVGGQKTKEEAWRLMATYIGHYQLRGYSYLALVEKTTNLLVGTVGLWKSEPWPELEMGYWLLDEMQGKGYAKEAGESVKAYAFDTLQVATLVSYIDDKNTASINLAERLGGINDGTIDLLDFGPHSVYRYKQ